MKARYGQRLTFAVMLMALSLRSPKPTAAAPLLQAGDPVAQCAKGVQLLLEGQADKALPLLEAGFANSDRETFADPDDLGMCALAVGLLRLDIVGDRSGALEAYAFALEVYRATANQELEGVALNNIAGVYRAQGRYDEALNSYQQALMIMRKVGNRLGEGKTMNNIAGVYRVQGRYAEALEYYQQALAIKREVGDRAGEAETLNNIGGVYRAQGRYAEALGSFQQALAILREIGDRPSEAETLNNIGGVYRRQGRYVEALESFQQALAITHEVDDQASKGTTLNGIGEVCYAQGQFTKALEYYQQALVIRREVGDRTGEGTTLHNIGVVYGAQGRYGEAFDIYQQALAIRREVGDRAAEGMTLSGIGLIHHDQGRYSEALDCFQQALVIAREVGDRAGEGATLNNIGIVYAHQGYYKEALGTYQQALAIRREVGDQLGEGVTLNNIGEVYRAQARYAEALEHYQQALTVEREVGDQAGEGATLNNIGIVYTELALHAEALEYYQQALAIVREVGDRVGEGKTLHNIGYSYQRQGKPDQALTHYEAAMEVLEAVRAVAGSEAGRAGFIAQYASLYDRAVGLYHAQGQDEQAFFTTERGRARAFLDSMATGHLELFDNTAAELLTREQEAYAARLSVQDALARARAQQPPDPALVADLEAQLSQAEQEHAAALAAIEARGGQLAALVPGRSSVLDLPGVQALLDEQTTLLSYFVLKDQTVVFIITHDSFHTVALDVSREDLTQEIQAFRQFPNLAVAHPESVVNLHDWLIEPLREYLTTPHLAIVPHSVLHYLPFAALTDGQRYLLDNYVTIYLPSASVLPFIRDNVGGAGGTPLILGDPATGDPTLDPLHYAERESRVVGDLHSTQPLIGEAATESALLQRASRASILHLAAHGVYNSYNPLYSAIALAPDEKNDGLLEVHEVYRLDLQNCELVVLSACKTQLGELGAEGETVGVNPGDEVVGLTRAFFFGGTPTVVASLWSVDDRPTGLLMERLYTHLQDGVGKAQALRQAQLDVREEYPNPHYWAAFVLSGDAGEISAYASPAKETTTPLPPTKAATAPVEETPTIEETATPAKGGAGICPAGTLIVALGVRVGFIAKNRGSRRDPDAIQDN